MSSQMRPYAPYIRNTGCKPTIKNIEELVNGNDDNLPLSTIQFGVKSQVALLERLHKDNMLGVN